MHTMKISLSGLGRRKPARTSQSSDVRPPPAPHFLHTPVRFLDLAGTFIQVANISLARVKSESHQDNQTVTTPGAHTSIRLVSIPIIESSFTH